MQGGISIDGLILLSVFRMSIIKRVAPTTVYRNKYARLFTPIPAAHSRSYWVTTYNHYTCLFALKLLYLAYKGSSK